MITTYNPYPKANFMTQELIDAVAEDIRDFCVGIKGAKHAAARALVVIRAYDAEHLAQGGDLYADVYTQCQELIEPHILVQRHGLYQITKDSLIPSVVDSLGFLVEFWVKHRGQTSAAPDALREAPIACPDCTNGYADGGLCETCDGRTIIAARFAPSAPDPRIASLKAENQKLREALRKIDDIHDEILKTINEIPAC